MPFAQSEAWEDALQLDPTTLAQGYRIQRQDGEVFCTTTRVIQTVINDSVFDDFDFDYGSADRIYRADQGASPTEIRETTGLQPDNYNLQFFLDEDFIKPDDIQNRRFAQAEVLTFVYDYTDLDKGPFELRLCYIGEAKMEGNVVTFEIKEMANKTAVRWGDLTSEICRHQFGDDSCMKDLDGDNPDGFPYRTTGEVAMVSSSREFTVDGIDGFPTNFFQYGHIKFLTGLNTGLAFDIESSDSDEMVLRLAPISPIQPGDELFLQGGCIKTWRACYEDHDNAINLGAEPRHPTPETANRTTGGG